VSIRSCSCRLSRRAPAPLVAALLGVIFLVPGALSAQEVRVGLSSSRFGEPFVTDDTIYTMVDSDLPATLDGLLSAATFVWSKGPCLDAVKIKVFRPTSVPVPTATLSYSFVAERGPFSIPAFEPSLPTLPFPDVRVSLVPPIPVERGDVLGITNVTGCGAPIVTVPFLGSPTPRSFVLSGDIVSDIFTVNVNPVQPAVMVFGTGPSPALSLLGDRFAVTVSARDPRTGQTTEGAPFKIANGSGFFALPGFTGDPLVPELTVKMVDATESASLGGTYWFFYAPLTDAELMITVTDQSNGAVRTYQSSSQGGAQLCGAADTSAFQP